MEATLEIEIAPQPDDSSCGPTSLHAVYRFYGDDIALPRVVSEVPELDEGGTVGAFLGVHALKRGYRVTLFSYNLQVMDPTWDGLETDQLLERLAAQRTLKRSAKLRRVTDAYLEFLRLGGRLRFEELDGALLRRYLDRGVPILAGLSATYLYREARERPDGRADDLRGKPAGHFVVLSGYDRRSRRILVADPLQPNRLSQESTYAVSIDRLIGAVFLGTATYDGNLLVLERNSR